MNLSNHSSRLSPVFNISSELLEELVTHEFDGSSDGNGSREREPAKLHKCHQHRAFSSSRRSERRPLNLQ